MPMPMRKPDPQYPGTSNSLVYQLAPAFVLVYGLSGDGKTTDAVASFPNALHIAARNALLPAYSLWGYRPDTIECKTIDDATAALNRATQSGKYDAVHVDDFSHLAENTYAECDRKYKGYKVFGALRDKTLAFRAAARHATFHVVLNCWLNPPRSKDGIFYRGGPMLSGKLPEQLPAMCDLVLRCDHEPMHMPGTWSGVYRCEHSPRFVMKDRFNVCYNLSPIPMNLGEILRAVGYDLSRHKSLPWQEQVVQQFSEELFSHSHTLDKDLLNQQYAKLIGTGIDPKFANWTMRDAMDRTIIRRAIDSQTTRFIA